MFYNSKKKKKTTIQIELQTKLICFQKTSYVACHVKISKIPTKNKFILEQNNSVI